MGSRRIASFFDRWCEPDVVTRRDIELPPEILCASPKASGSICGRKWWPSPPYPMNAREAELAVSLRVAPRSAKHQRESARSARSRVREASSSPGQAVRLREIHASSPALTHREVRAWSVFPSCRRALNWHSIGFVFQEPTLMQLKPACGKRPLAAATRACATWKAVIASMTLAQVGLVEFADAYPLNYRRHEDAHPPLARALVTDPDILLMDEPFAALDRNTHFRLNNDLLSLWLRLRKDRSLP